MSLLVRWQKTALLALLKGRLECRAKPNVPFVRLVRITRLFNFSFSSARESLRLFELKKMCGGEMPKHSRTLLKNKTTCE